MARYASINNLNQSEELKNFNLDDYSFAKIIQMNSTGSLQKIFPKLC